MEWDAVTHLDDCRNSLFRPARAPPPALQNEPSDPAEGRPSGLGDVTEIRDGLGRVPGSITDHAGHRRQCASRSQSLHAEVVVVADST